MRACGGDLQAGALGGSNQFATGAMHFDAQLADVFTNFRAGLDDGLMHFVLDLFDDVRRSGGDELHHVRAELAGSGINDLKFFFYADGEAVSHGVALRDLKLWGLLARIIPRWCGKYILARLAGPKFGHARIRSRRIEKFCAKKEGQTRATALYQAYLIGGRT